MTTNPKSKSLLFASIACLIATGFHLYLTHEFYNIKLGLGVGHSICNLSAKFNCEAVAASPYASFYGIPMALLGALTNITTIILLLISYFSFCEQPKLVARYAFWMNIVIATASIGMGFISLLLLGYYCLFCMFTYALSFFSLYFSYKGLDDSPLKHLSQDLPALAKSEKWVAIMITMIPLFAYLGNNIMLSDKANDDLNAIVVDSMNNWISEPLQTFNTDLGFKIGSSNPKMILVEFADFRCPHCKHAAPTLKAFVASRPDVTLVFKPFPLDGSCNPSPSFKGMGDGVSCKLAYISWCAETLQKNGWMASDYIFENQERLQNEVSQVINELLLKLNLSENELNTCIQDPQIQKAITSMAQEGVTANIHGTPTIFANGKLLKGGQLLPVLEAAYKMLSK